MYMLIRHENSVLSYIKKKILITQNSFFTNEEKPIIFFNKVQSAFWIFYVANTHWFFLFKRLKYFDIKDHNNVEKYSQYT